MESRIRAERQHVSELVTRLDLATKVRLLTGATAFTLHGDESIGLPPMAFSDGPTGVRGLTFTGGEPVALFPSATVLASSWDEDLLDRVGRMLAVEARRQGIHVVLGPTINLHRSALGGRLFEQFSEDPLLTGRLAAAYVRGMQSQGVGACLKHLVANESETRRNFMNSVVSERALREVYLLPFEIAVVEADPWAVMSAYNDINGIPATEHQHLNNAVLRDEWHYWGLLMSDWCATKTSAEAALGGLDLVMPGPDGPWGQALVDDVEAGRVPEAVIDRHVRRVLWLAHRTGALSAPRRFQGPFPAPDSEQRRRELRELATAGFTLLKNSGDLLPLPDTTELALIGRHAVRTVCMGGGSASLNPPHQISIADGLAARTRTLTVLDGVPVRFRPAAANPDDVTDPTTGEPGVRLRLEAAGGRALREWGSTVAATSLEPAPNPADDPERLTFTATLTGTGSHELGVIGTGRWTLTVDGRQVATTELVADGYDPGEVQLIAPAWTTTVDAGTRVEAVWERVRTEPVPTPDGRLGVIPQTIASGYGYKGLVAGPVPPDPQDAIAAAAKAAAAADVAVVVVGLTPDEETESRDKATLALPGAQDALVHAVAAAARRTVVVVNSSTPVLMPWEDEVDAVLVVGLPGQEGGHAVADVLYGDAEPTGRLVTTWPAADGAAPAWQVDPSPGLDLAYTDETHIGYRGWHAGHAPPPAHWFGEGLGYGCWEYGECLLVTRVGTPAVAVDVTNTGTRTSREVVQLYFAPDTPDQPVRLVGWAGVTVEAGQTSRVLVTGEPRLWRTWDEAAGAWAELPVSGELLVARGLGDIRARVPVS